VKPDTLEAICGYRFTRPELLQQALTHRSYSRSGNNERLEFLGDSVLSLSITRYIYENFSDADEGELSRIRASLVKQSTLAAIARTNQLGDQLRLGGGELKSGGFRRASILSDALEAIIGAVCLDSDFEQANRFVLELYRSQLENLSGSELLKDPKTRLQELLQGRQNELPVYSVVQTTGKDHDQTFTVTCSLPQFSLETRGKGSSRKKAEQVAAEKALKRISR